MKSIIFAFLSVVATVAFFVTGVVYLIAKTFGQLAWDPKSKAFKRMLASMRSRLLPLSSELVPWDSEMLGLLSLNQAREKKPGWFNPVSMGQFTTIYQEPVLAFARQQSGKIGIALWRTSDREFIFRQKGAETEIWLDNQPFGLYVDGTLLAPGKGSKLLARLENKPDEAQAPLLLGTGTALTLSNPGRASGPNPRALTLLRQLSAEEENIALAVVLLQLTQR